MTAPRIPIRVHSRWWAGFGAGLVCGLCFAALWVAL